MQFESTSQLLQQLCENALPQNTWYALNQEAPLIELQQTTLEYSQQACVIVLFSQDGLPQFNEQIRNLILPLINTITAVCCYTPEQRLKPAIALHINAPVAHTKAQLVRDTLPSALECVVLSGLTTMHEPGLLVMDMDSTAIQIECIDEIARLANVYDGVASVTKQAMQGSLAFSDSLRLRVAKLKGVELGLLAELKENLPLMPGVDDLCEVLKQHQWQLMIASGGFIPFAKSVQQRLGLDRVHANQLADDGKTLTGEVIGDIVDADEKARFLKTQQDTLSLSTQQTVAMGDGANDLVMMAASGLGISVHGKPKVEQQADVAIKQGSLLQVLYFIGLPR